MPKRSSLHARTSDLTTPGRVLVAVAVFALLTALTGLLPYLIGDRRTAGHPASRATASASATAPATASPTPSASAVTGRGSVASPPNTTDPVLFGKAAAKALWSYDTRTLSQPEQLAGLKVWMTAEKKYADWSSVTAQLPDRQLWKQLHGNGQYATAKVSEGHIPSAFTAALNADPGAITTAYVYAVTVSGRQTIAWDEGGSGAESRSVTLAVQCRPEQHCALSGIAPSVSP
ncbi:MAG: hypothetical protein QOF84_5346 [Streptomyces sp.]|jgi:hypothetical protein|nr:hypothetical protein [Streptomyces sp.]